VPVPSLTERDVCLEPGGRVGDRVDAGLPQPLERCHVPRSPAFPGARVGGDRSCAGGPGRKTSFEHAHQKALRNRWWATRTATMRRLRAGRPTASLCCPRCQDCAGVYLYKIAEHRRARVDEPRGDTAGCQASWSPDGSQVVYQSDRDADYSKDDYYDVYVYDLRSHAHRRVTRASGGYPVWSPDSDWIVYYAPGRDQQLYRIHPDGTGDERYPHLDDPTVRARGVDWSPDGSWIAFGVGARLALPQPPGPAMRVFTADSNGRGARLATGERWEQVQPVYSPGQGRLGLVVSGSDWI
jgi:hypothetical protein